MAVNFHALMFPSGGIGGGSRAEGGLEGWEDDNTHDFHITLENFCCSLWGLFCGLAELKFSVFNPLRNLLALDL